MSMPKSNFFFYILGPFSTCFLLCLFICAAFIDVESLGCPLGIPRAPLGTPWAPPGSPGPPQASPGALLGLLERHFGASWERPGGPWGILCVSLGRFRAPTGQ